MRQAKLTALAFVIGLATTAGSAQATMIFSDRNDFDAATAGLSFEGFNTSFSPTSSLIFDDFSVTGANFSFPTNPRFISEGTGAIQYTSSSAGTSVTFTFNSPINTFGIDINDWGTTGGDGSGSVLAVSNSTGTFDETLGTMGPTLPQGNTIFFGVIDPQSFSTVTIFADANGDIIGLDALAYGTTDTGVIPEPSSLALLGIGTICLGLGLVRRRRLEKRPV